MNRNPGGLLEAGRPTIGSTAVAWEAGKPIVTYPIPGVQGATATATLDDRFMAERVVVKLGTTTTEFTYSDYQDWNNPLNLLEAYYAGKVTERRNGEIQRELTTVQTETGSVYVVMPVPASVGRGEPTPLFATDRSAELRSDRPTPRLADGKPDLSGNWGAGGMNWRYGNRRCAPTQLEGCTTAWKVEGFTRHGDEILYEVTVEDPLVLVEPWVMTPRILRLSSSPDAGLLPERGNCEVYELEDITTQIRH